MRLAPLLLLAAVALAACGPRPKAAPPAPAPAIDAPAIDAPGEEAAARPPYSEQCVPEEGCVTVCVLRDGRRAEVSVLVDARTGDSTYLGRPFARAFPVDSTYAASASGFVDHCPIALSGPGTGS